MGEEGSVVSRRGGAGRLRERVQASARSVQVPSRSSGAWGFFLRPLSSCFSPDFCHPLALYLTIFAFKSISVRIRAPRGRVDITEGRQRCRAESWGRPERCPSGPVDETPLSCSRTTPQHSPHQAAPPPILDTPPTMASIFSAFGALFISFRPSRRPLAVGRAERRREGLRGCIGGSGLTNGL